MFPGSKRAFAKTGKAFRCGLIVKNSLNKASIHKQAVGSWIWLPLRLEASLSEDGRTFRDVGAVDAAADERQGGVLTETFTVDTGPQQARYVRLRGVNRRLCPDWHGGGGGLAWIFADEIVVE